MFSRDLPHHRANHAVTNLGRRRNELKSNGLTEIAMLRQSDIDGIEEAVTFMSDFNYCLSVPRDDLARALDSFFAKYNTILG